VTQNPRAVQRPVRYKRSIAAFALALLAAGCPPNPPTPYGLPTPLGPQTPVRIWSGGQVQKWHAVIITEQWVSGIPYQMPVTCDSCVLRIPRTQVDSMKIEHTKGNALEVVGVLAAILVAEYVVCAVIGPNNCSN